MSKNLVSLLLLLTPLLYHAQLDSKVTTGVVAYESYDYEKALVNLDIALAEPGNLKTKTVPKAYYYRGMTYTALLREAASKSDVAALEKYSNGYLLAFNDFIQAKELPEPNKYVEKATSQLTLLEPSLIQAALTALTSASAAGPGAQQFELYKTGRDYARAVIDYSGNYLAWDVHGQCMLGSGDAMKGHESFASSIASYAANPPALPDSYMAYVYYRKAMIEYTSFERTKEALASIQAGLEFVTSEKKRLLAQDSGSPDLANFDQVQGDLETFELELYLNSNPVPEEAFEKFESAVEQDPENFSIILAYASLMERKDVDKAIELYKQALDINPDGYTAHYNLGALYMNHAVELHQIAINIRDIDAYEKEIAKVEEYMRLALPHLEKAHEGMPNEIVIIDAIINVCLQLEEQEKFLLYKEKKEAVNP